MSARGEALAPPGSEGVGFSCLLMRKEREALPTAHEWDAGCMPVGELLLSLPCRRMAGNATPGSANVAAAPQEPPRDGGLSAPRPNSHARQTPAPAASELDGQQPARLSQPVRTARLLSMRRALESDFTVGGGIAAVGAGLLVMGQGIASAGDKMGKGIESAGEKLGRGIAHRPERWSSAIFAGGMIGAAWVFNAGRNGGGK